LDSLPPAFRFSGSSKVDNGDMSAAVWIVIGVIAVGTVAAGLVRMRAWLQKPVPPEVIEAAHRDDDKDDT
jgi:hypothetical protein